MFFNMTAIENVMFENDMEDFTALGRNQGVLKTFKLYRDCAYFGMKAGCKKEGVEMPFASSEELGDNIDSFDQLTPAMEGFTKAVGDFFQVKGLETKTPKRKISR